MQRIIIREETIFKLIKSELAFDEYIDLGPTGRTRLEARWRPEDPPREVPERAEFAIYEVADRANVLSDDDLQDAAEDGLRHWLQDNREELKAKINTAAQIMRSELMMEEVGA